MDTSQSNNNEVARILWGVSAKTEAKGKLGVSAALWDIGHRDVLEISRPGTDVYHVLSVWNKGRARSLLYLDGKQRFDSIRDRNSFQMARAGETVRAVISETSGSCLDIYVPASFLTGCAESELDANGTAMELLPVALERDAVVSRVADLLASELQSPGLASRTAIDSAALLLCVTLIRKYSNQSARSLNSPSGLAAWQKRRAIDFMQTSLPLNVGLVDLSSQVGLSPFHFARAFKKSLGIPPHQYLIQLRIERAKTLLTTTQLSVGEIAVQVGYKNVGYFDRLFRRSSGVSPGQFRRERGI